MIKFSRAWLKCKLRFLKNMDCPDQAKCFKVLQFVLDEEADEAEKAQFKIQIKNCMPCYEKYHLDAAIKEVLQTKLEVKPVPEDLVDNIKLKIKNAV